jgi:ADP-L-glycero-D-manno-heptose 6-epimerase
MYTKGSRADIMYKWREEAKSTGTIKVWNNAEHIKRDWVWVGDVCRLHIDFIKQVNGSGIWNVGTGLSHSYLDIATEIAEQEDATIEFIEAGATERYDVKADLKHLKATIGKRKWLNIYEWIDRRNG